MILSHCWLKILTSSFACRRTPIFITPSMEASGPKETVIRMKIRLVRSIHSFMICAVSRRVRLWNSDRQICLLEFIFQWAYLLNLRCRSLSSSLVVQLSLRRDPHDILCQHINPIIWCCWGGCTDVIVFIFVVRRVLWEHHVKVCLQQWCARQHPVGMSVCWFDMHLWIMPLFE